MTTSRMIDTAIRKLAIKSKIGGFFGEKGGNFALMAALVLPVALMAGSVALDTANAVSLKTRLQNAVDSAALATSTRLMTEGNLTVLDAKAFAEKFLNGQLLEDQTAFAGLTIEPTVSIVPVIKDGSTIWKVSIVLDGTLITTPMSRLLGQEKMTIKVAGKSQSGVEASKGALSMTLVLDKSGSMAWDLDGQIKITVLKTAVVGLLTQFELADPNEEYVRVGGVSYDTAIDKKQNLKWGTKYAGKFTDKLEAEGGTDSTDAFKWAYEKVIDKKENDEHAKENGQVPTKYILFMTDGDNNFESADSSTKKLCDAAKKDNVVVYTVAFAAPPRGKELLSYCATSASHFFDAKNSAELIAAFEKIGQQTSKIVSRLTE